MYIQRSSEVKNLDPTYNVHTTEHKKNAIVVYQCHVILNISFYGEGGEGGRKKVVLSERRIILYDRL